LHLVGILFPHINDDAQSKSHQIQGMHWVILRQQRNIKIGLIIPNNNKGPAEN